ncbi:MAG: hypothetical protein F6K42_29480, partial [Leptolyngbya sp. SIO1D8]|nr:hypothetical protein [Leptolyngbya sp. SIO1D8]
MMKPSLITGLRGARLPFDENGYHPYLEKAMDPLGLFDQAQKLQDTLFPEEPDYSTTPALVPIAGIDGPILVSQNEPVDPRDCERWPNSPYCDFQMSPSLANVEVEVTETECERCVTFQPVALGFHGPPTTICYRSSKPECQPKTPPPVLITPLPEENIELPIQAPAGFHRVVIAESSVYFTGDIRVRMWGTEYEGRTRNWSISRELRDLTTATLNNLRGGEFFHDFRGAMIIADGLPMFSYPHQTRAEFEAEGFAYFDEQIGSFPSRLTFVRGGFRDLRNTVENPYDTVLISTGEIREGVVTLWRVWLQADVRARYKFTDLPCEDYPFPGNAIDKVVDAIWSDPFKGGYNVESKEEVRELIYGVASFCPNNQPFQPRSGDRGDDPMKCNCDEIEELLREIYNRLGCAEYPVSAPVNVALEDEGTQAIENLTQLSEWMFRQIDGISGQFPIEIEIEDTDPTTEGRQTETVSLPNISEALAEIFGLTYRSQMTSDLNADILIRLIGEVISGKNAAIIAQSYAKANASFLGYPG